MRPPAGRELALLLMPALLSGCAVFGGLRGPGAAPATSPVSVPAPPSAPVELPPSSPGSQPGNPSNSTPSKPLMEVPAPVNSTPATPGLIALASASADVKGVTVTLGIRNSGSRPVTFRYTPQVNWGSCELPPLVAIVRADGKAVAAPSTGGRIGCTEILLTRTLAPGDTLTLKRLLPPLTLGTYRLTAWLDAESAGMPMRVQAEPVALVVR